MYIQFYIEFNTLEPTLDFLLLHRASEHSSKVQMFKSFNCFRTKQLRYLPKGRVECDPPHFFVRVTFCTFSRPSHIKMLVLHLFFFKLTFSVVLKHLKKSSLVRALHLKRYIYNNIWFMFWPFNFNIWYHTTFCFKVNSSLPFLTIYYFEF